MARKPRMETRTLQQALLGSSPKKFLDDLNALLLDGWTVVTGSFSVSSLPVVADERTPPQFVNRDGVTYRTSLFVVIERTEVVDPEMAKRVLELEFGGACPELNRTA